MTDSFSSAYDSAHDFFAATISFSRAQNSGEQQKDFSPRFSRYNCFQSVGSIDPDAESPKKQIERKRGTMKKSSAILTTTTIDKIGDRISEEGIVEMYGKMLIPQLVMKEHNTVEPPTARLVSKWLAIGISVDVCGKEKFNQLLPNGGIIARSSNASNGGKFTDKEIIDLYRRLALPSTPNFRGLPIGSLVMSKYLAIGGELEILDDERSEGIRGMSISFSSRTTVKHGRNPHLTISANPLLFDIKDVESALKFSKPEFQIGVSPRQQKSAENFPWIIVLSFVAYPYFQAFLSEIGKTHGKGITDWLGNFIRKYRSKATDAGKKLTFQLTMPVKIDDADINLALAIDSNEITSIRFDKAKIIEEIERQSGRKICDIQHASVSYLGEGVYRLEYAVDRNTQVITPTSASLDKSVK